MLTKSNVYEAVTAWVAFFSFFLFNFFHLQFVQYSRDVFLLHCLGFQQCALVWVALAFLWESAGKVARRCKFELTG